MFVFSRPREKWERERREKWEELGDVGCGERMERLDGRMFLWEEEGGGRRGG